MVSATWNWWRFHSSLLFSLIIQTYSECSHWCKPTGQRRRICWILSHLDTFYSYNAISEEFLIHFSIPSWRAVYSCKIKIWSTGQYEGKQLENWQQTVCYVYCTQMWIIFVLHCIYLPLNDSANLFNKIVTILCPLLLTSLFADIFSFVVDEWVVSSCLEMEVW
jgi:hypothetical protein